MSRICLIMAPYFVPLAPPLGISLLKAHLEREGHSVQCIDFNVDPTFWSLHLQYMRALETLDKNIVIEGQSRLWAIRNAHLLAVLNGASPEKAQKFVRRITPYYGIDCTEAVSARLCDIACKVFAHAETLLNGYDFREFSLVGCSTFSTSLALSLFTLRAAKRSNPAIRTLIGGGVFADDLAPKSQNFKTLVEEYPFVDQIVVGEGELILSMLVDGQFRDRKHISMDDVNGDTLPLQDSAIPDFSDFNTDRYFHLTLEGGRSCPFQCAFCSETIQWGKYRKKTSGMVAGQMGTLAASHGNTKFFMGDSLMNPYIESLSTELLKSNHKLMFDGYLRADPLPTDPERTARWASSGCYRVRLGIESGAADVLEMIDKRTGPTTISRALNSLANAGIRTTTYWIVGFPGETEKSFQETLTFIEGNQESIYEVEAHPFTYFPTGQVASDRWKPVQVYDEDIQKAIKFTVWDVVAADPPREERYRRLRRVATLAAKLGVKNLYSFKDRLDAEGRWAGLHPKAVAAY
ncbi:MAG: radical SAM protein [Bryobacteraceae bacterium]|nr:radical SAM protein [Bryobacteraceae bacterium]